MKVANKLAKNPGHPIFESWQLATTQPILCAQAFLFPCQTVSPLTLPPQLDTRFANFLSKAFLETTFQLNNEEQNGIFQAPPRPISHRSSLPGTSTMFFQ